MDNHEDKKENEESIKKFFEERINQSGHPLENKVQKILEEYFYYARREYHYLDKDKDEDRTIDFLISEQCHLIRLKKETIMVNLEMTIECKSLPDHAWIFSGWDSNESATPDYIYEGDELAIMRQKEIIPLIKGKFFVADSYHEEFRDNASNPKSNKRKDNLYNAILQATKANRHRIDYRERSFELKSKLKKDPHVDLHVFQPVIIFQGRMYKTVQRDKMELEPIKFASIGKEYLSKNYHENRGEIHIVSFDWLREYLGIIKNTYRIGDGALTLREVLGLFGEKRQRANE